MPEYKDQPGRKMADEGLPEYQDHQLIDGLIADAVEYIHGKAQEEVISALANTEDITGSMAALTYKITKGVLDNNKKAAISMHADMNHATAVGTEVVDMLAEILERIEPEAAFDIDKLKEESFTRAMVMHGEQMEGDPANKEEAGILFEDMLADGTVQQGMDYVNQRATQDGVSTADMERKGLEMAREGARMSVPEKNPVAAGVEQGLMDGGMA